MVLQDLEYAQSRTVRWQVPQLWSSLQPGRVYASLLHEIIVQDVCLPETFFNDKQAAACSMVALAQNIPGYPDSSRRQISCKTVECKTCRDSIAYMYGNATNRLAFLVDIDALSLRAALASC